jgi:hypothetical protein
MSKRGPQTKPLNSDDLSPDAVSPDEADCCQEFGDLFETEGDQAVIVDLVRIFPKVYQGVETEGHLCTLDPGTTLSDIKKRFGGGTYLIKARDALTRKFITIRKVKIAPAIPKLTDDDIPKDGSGAKPTSVPSVTIEGVQIPLDQTEYIQKLVLWMRAVNTMFPNPQDALIATLLEAVKEKNAPTPDALEYLGKMRMALPELFERSSDGANLYTLLQETVKQAGLVLGNYRPPMQRSTLLLGKRADEPSVSDSGPSENTTQGDASMQSKQSPLMVILSEIVKAFRLMPPKEPARVANMLHKLFPLTPSDRLQVGEMRQVGFDIAENELVDDFEQDPEMRKKFTSYYNEVVDLYLKTEE